MAKRIKLFSTLPLSKKNHISNMIENGELQFISVNSSVDSKKGVIVTLDDDEYLIIMDTFRKVKHKELDDDEEDDSDEDAELEAEIDDELVIEEVGEAEEVKDVADVDDDDDDDDDIDKEEID